MIAASGWFAARPSGTEDIYKIYAESLRSEDHLRAILREAQGILVLGGLTILSAIVFRGLKSDDGEAVSQHKAILASG